MNQTGDFDVYLIEKNFKDKDVFRESDGKKMFVAVDNDTAIAEDLISYKNDIFMMGEDAVIERYNNRDYGEYTVTKIITKRLFGILRKNNEEMLKSNIETKGMIERLEKANNETNK